MTNRAPSPSAFHPHAIAVRDSRRTDLATRFAAIRAHTPAGHSRTTYRNFFPPATRWQFSGIRLAKDPV